MRSAEITPTVYNYSIIVRAYGEAGQCEEAERHFSAIPIAGLEHNSMSFKAMIDAYTKALRFKDADALYQTMLAEGLLTHWSTTRPGQMDLHQHSYGTALAAMRRVFTAMCDPSTCTESYMHDLDKTLYIITGHGKTRVLNDGSVVQRFVLRWLDEQSMAYSIDNNEGRVVVLASE